MTHTPAHTHQERGMTHTHTHSTCPLSWVWETTLPGGHKIIPLLTSSLFTPLTKTPSWSPACPTSNCCLNVSSPARHTLSLYREQNYTLSLYRERSYTLAYKLLQSNFDDTIYSRQKKHDPLLEIRQVMLFQFLKKQTRRPKQSSPPNIVIGENRSIAGQKEQGRQAG